MEVSFGLQVVSLPAEQISPYFSGVPLVPKHHCLPLQYNRTNSLVRPTCKECWKPGNAQEVAREHENLPCSLGGLAALLQSKCLGADDYAPWERHHLEREEIIKPVEGDTQVEKGRSKEQVNATGLFFYGSGITCSDEEARLH